MRTVRFQVKADQLKGLRPVPPGDRVWVVVEDDAPGAEPPVSGWLLLPADLRGREHSVADSLATEIRMRVKFGPEEDDVEALASMLEGDCIRRSNLAPIPFDSSTVPARVRAIAGLRRPPRK